MNRTKIIATIGPASDSLATLGEFIDAGVDVFRLNCSHGTAEERTRTTQRIRTVCAQKNATAAIMVDLCGPKIRVGQVENGSFQIKPGDHIDILAEAVAGNASRISTNRPQLTDEVAAGQRVLIDDGSVRLRVESAAAGRLRCACEIGGAIATHKGINLPDSKLAMSALTDKDKQDLAWAIEHEADYVALSFVRTAADIDELRALLPADGTLFPVVAKIETPQAIAHLDEIIAGADVVLVARGDLGVEMDLTQVPLLQKDIARRCRAAGKPVIIATQMLQSMVNSPTATRAEVSDVANAVMDLADCLMLSAETSTGAYPVQSVRMMECIAGQTEAFLAADPDGGHAEQADVLHSVTTAVAHSATVLAREMDAKLVAVWTETGHTVQLLSKCRLNQPVIGFSPHDRVCRRMAMYYGIIPLRLTRNPRLLEMLREADRLLIEQRLAAPGDNILVIAGTRLERTGSTSAMLMHIVGEELSGALPAQA